MQRMDERITDHVARTLLLAPIIFIGHFVEEAPGFVAWFNAHVARGITSGLFWRVNISALVITLIVVVVEWLSRTMGALLLAIAWVSFLMLANAVLHVAGAFVDRQYVPGLATAVLLYLPYSAWLFRKAVQSRRVKVTGLVAAALLGALPMLIHGYLIIFRGSRLF